MKKTISRITLLIMFIVLVLFVSGCSSESKDDRNNIGSTSNIGNASNNTPTQVVKKTEPYRGVEFGMGKEDIIKMEETVNSYKQETVIQKYLGYFITTSSEKYASLSYEFEDNKIIGFQLYSSVPLVTDDMPEYIERNYIQPDDLYKELTNELTSLYGSPKVTSNTVVWENDYEIIEGGIRDFETTAVGGGHYVDPDTGKQSDTLKGRRCDFFIQLKDSNGNACGWNYWEQERENSTPTLELTPTEGVEPPSGSINSACPTIDTITEYIYGRNGNGRTAFSSVKVVSYEERNNDSVIVLEMEGITSDSDYCGFSLKCYDEYGILLGRQTNLSNIAPDEKFRITERITIFKGTKRITVSNYDEKGKHDPLPYNPDLSNHEVQGGLTNDNRKGYDQIDRWEDYVFGMSSTRELTDEDLYGVDEAECKLAINEIYARYGMKFKDKELQKYFDSKEWYIPLYEQDVFDDEWLDEYSTENIEILKQYEADGYPYDDYDSQFRVLRTVEFAPIDDGFGDVLYLEYFEPYTSMNPPEWHGLLTVVSTIYYEDGYAHTEAETVSFVEDETGYATLIYDDEILPITYTINYDNDENYYYLELSTTEEKHIFIETSGKTM